MYRSTYTTISQIFNAADEPVKTVNRTRSNQYLLPLSFFFLQTALRKFCINLIQNICDYIHVATSMDAVSRSRICHRECTYIHYVLGSIRVYYSEVIQSVLSTKRLKIHSCLSKRSIAPQHMFALLALSRSNESRDQIKQ